MSPDLFKTLTRPYSGLIDTIIQSMDEGRLLEVSYQGHSREIEAHALGMSTAGNPVLRAFQTGGYTEGGEDYGWKLLRLDRFSRANADEDTPQQEAFSFAIPLDVRSHAPRPDYNPSDKGMMFIFKRV